MNRKHTQIAISTIAGFFLLALLIITAISSPAREARADTVPTPVSLMNQSEQAALVAFSDGTSAITSDTGTPGLQLYTYEYCNIQYIIDQNAGNAITLTVQWSMDNTTWSDGPNLVAGNSADADAIVQVPNLGRYIRIYQDVANTNPVTVTAKGVCK